MARIANAAQEILASSKYDGAIWTELAQTLLAYGCFRRDDNAQEDRALIEPRTRQP